MWRTHRSRTLNGSLQQPPSQGVNNRADGCMASGSGVLNGVSGIPGDLPEYVTLPSHAGLYEGGPTFSLATRGTNMENNNEKEVKAKEMVKEISIKKGNINMGIKHSVENSDLLKTEQNISEATYLSVKDKDNIRISSEPLLVKLDSSGTAESLKNVYETEEFSKTVEEISKDENTLEKMTSEEVLDASELKLINAKILSQDKRQSMQNLTEKSLLAESSLKNIVLEIKGPKLCNKRKRLGKRQRMKLRAEQALLAEKYLSNEENFSENSDLLEKKQGDLKPIGMEQNLLAAHESSKISNLLQSNKGENISETGETSETVNKSSENVLSLDKNNIHKSLAEDKNDLESTELKLELLKKQENSGSSGTTGTAEPSACGLEKTDLILKVPRAAEAFVLSEVPSSSVLKSTEIGNQSKPSESSKNKLGKKPSKKRKIRNNRRKKEREKLASSNNQGNIRLTSAVFLRDIWGNMTGNRGNIPTIQGSLLGSLPILPLVQEKLLQNQSLLESSHILPLVQEKLLQSQSLIGNSSILPSVQRNQENMLQYQETLSGARGILPLMQVSLAESYEKQPRNHANLSGTQPARPRNQESLGDLPKNQASLSRIEENLSQYQENLGKWDHVSLSRNEGNPSWYQENLWNLPREEEHLFRDHVSLSRNEAHTSRYLEYLPRNEGSLPRDYVSLSRNEAHTSRYLEYLPRNEGSLPRDYVSLSRNEAHTSRCLEYLPRNEESLPRDYVNLSRNEENIFRYQETLGNLLQNQGNLRNLPTHHTSFSWNETYSSHYQENADNLLRKQTNRYPRFPENLSLPSTSRTQEQSSDSFNSIDRSPRSGKRKRSRDTSPLKTHDNKRFSSSEKDSTSQESDLTRVIMSEDFGSSGLTIEELMYVRAAISHEIDTIQVGPAPRFNNTYLESGGIVVDCADEWSRDWLTEKVPKLHPWIGAKLKIVDPPTLEVFHRAILWIPGMIENAEIVLERLERQNPGLKTGNWRVYSEEETYNLKGYNLIVGIPDTSVAALGGLDFKPYLGMNRVTITLTQPKDLGEDQEISPRS